MLKNKKLLIAVIAMLVAAALLLTVYFFTRPEPQEGSKAFTVTVVHKDGTSKDFSYESDEKYLGTVILAEGLVEGEIGAYGLFISTVDGETADYSVDSGWWALYEGDQIAMQGADTTPITDGGIYKLVYTVG